VSKRHQSSRRKTYGRRQHEVRERRTRDDVAIPMDDELDDTGATGLSDRFSFLEARSPSLRFALGD
jgi:hypothetical protein